MPGSSTHESSPPSDPSIPNQLRQRGKQKLTGSKLPGSKKKEKNAKDSGGVVAAVTKHGAKFSAGSASKDSSTPAESPWMQSPDLKPAVPASIPTNGQATASPLLDAASATSISASTAPSAADWTRAMGPLAGSPSNLISIMGDSPPTLPSSYEDPRGAPYGWGAHQQQQRHLAGHAYSASPPAGIRRPLSFQMDHYPASDFRSQASSPPSARRGSMHSPFGGPRVGSNPPLPHQPQAHFYGAPDIDLDIHPKTGLKAGERGFYFGFDTLPRPNNASASANVVLAGYEGGMDIYSVNKRGIEPLATLKGLRGGVHYAKILPWASTPDPLGIFPLVAVVVHGPVPPLNTPDITVETVYDHKSTSPLDGTHTPQSDSNQRHQNLGKTLPVIEAYQTSVEVYSLTTNALIDVLLQAPRIPIKTSVTSPVFRSPQPTGAFQIRADDGNIVVTSGTTGECWVFRQLRDDHEPGYRFGCVGKLWTSLQQPLKSDATAEDEGTSSPVAGRKRQQMPIVSVKGRWLAYCPPAASSQIALNAFIPVPIEGKAPGLTTLTSPVLPNESAEVDQPISDGVMNRIMRETTQEFIHGARWVGKQGMQLWNNYWKTGQQPPARNSNVGSPPWGSTYPGRSDSGQFPPTYGVSGQAVTKEPGLVSIIDLHGLTSSATIHPTTTFKPPLGCSFLSLSPTGLSLFTASSKGDVQTVWDLMRIHYTKSSPLQNSIASQGHPTRVRQIAQFSRMTVARIVDITWTKPNGERAAMVTERGTVHMLDMPPGAFTWPPPRRRAPVPDPVNGGSEHTPSATSAVSIASNALSSAYGATRPLLNAHRRTISNSQGAATIMDRAGYGGKVIAAGISHSLGNAGTAINQLRHTGENRVSLPLRNMPAGPCCAMWVASKRHHTLFVLGDGLVRMFPSRNRHTSMRKDRSRPKYNDFKLRDLPDDWLAPLIKQMIDPIEDLDLSNPDHDGGNTLVFHPRPLSGDFDLSPEVAIPQAEIESNAPYQPFHTDRRVGLHVYDSGTSDGDLSTIIRRMDSTTLDDVAPKRKKTRATVPATSQAWAFGQPIAMVKLDLGLPAALEDDISGSVDDHRALPVSAMERVLQVGDNDEQIVVTTRRRRGGNRDTDADDDGFFEDDCEVLDFADQRV